MRYEIKKILSCKILMISMIVAFIFSMAISYNAYANEKINLREFSAYIGDFSEQKYDVIEQKVMELQNKYEETQNADVMNEMFVYLTLDKDALNCHNVVEYRDSVISDSEIKIKTESGYYKRMNETINKLYGKKTNLVIGESETLNEVYDLFCVTDIVDIVFIIVIILFSSFFTSSPPVKSLYRTCFINLRQADECPIRLPYKSCVFYSFSSPQWQCFLQFDALGHPIQAYPFFFSFTM